MSDETNPAQPPPDRRAVLLASKGLPANAQPYISIEVFMPEDGGDPVTLILENEVPGEPSGVKPLQLAALVAASNLIEGTQKRTERILLTQLVQRDQERRAMIWRMKQAVEEELAGAVPYPPVAGSSEKPN